MTNAEFTKQLIALMVEGVSYSNLSLDEAEKVKDDLYPLQSIKKFLDNHPGMSLDEIDPESGLTPLIHAISIKNRTYVELLLDRGADVNACDAHQRSPLSWAAQHPYQYLLFNILQHRPLLDHRDSRGMTALFRARDNNAVKQILGAGADINVVDNINRNALDYAINTQHDNKHILFYNHLILSKFGSKTPDEFIQRYNKDISADEIVSIINNRAIYLNARDKFAEIDLLTLILSLSSPLGLYLSKDTSHCVHCFLEKWRQQLDYYQSKPVYDQWKQSRAMIGFANPSPKELSIIESMQKRLDDQEARIKALEAQPVKVKEPVPVAKTWLLPPIRDKTPLGNKKHTHA